MRSPQFGVAFVDEKLSSGEGVARVTAVGFDTGAYLNRIGMALPVKADLETLERLTRAHLLAVPFENMMVYDEHQEPSLEPEDLFDKVVNRNRGGYCFELNKCYYLLLKGLGYDCYPIPARVIHNRPEPCGISHRGTVIRIDGKRYFGDVGFGGAGPKGLVCLETQEVQTVAGEQFLVRPDGDSFVITILEPTGPENVLRIHDYPWLEPDFLTLNRFYATYHGSPFKNKRILYRCTPQGWVSLTDKVFTVKENGVKTVQTLESEEQTAAVIRQYFGLEIPVCTQ